MKKQTIKISHRPHTQWLIIVTSHGELMKTTKVGTENFSESPCYAPDKYYRCNAVTCSEWSKYPSQSAAIQAMKKYDADVTLIGEF